jgi:hypothetical protein
VFFPSSGHGDGLRRYLLLVPPKTPKTPVQE